MEKILIVEDDMNLATAVAGTLEMSGYQVKHLLDGNNILEVISEFVPDVILMDVMLNDDQNGFELTKQVRSNSNIPIIFTTSRQESRDIETGFSFPNTDYIRKPYRVAEVLIRVKNILQRGKQQEEIYPLYIGEYRFYPNQRSLKFEKRSTKLTIIDSAVLHLLHTNINKFISREEIVRKIWGVENVRLKDGSLNNTTSRLRKYLKNDTNVHIESRNALGIRLLLLEKL
jgi:DNA-binding response OmpR family regulator